jgi:hypothetical protein
MGLPGKPEKLVNKFNLLRRKIARHEANSRYIATWMIEACNEAEGDRVSSTDEYQWQRACYRLGSYNRVRGSANDRYFVPNQFNRNRWYLINLRSLAMIYHHITMINKSDFVQTLDKSVTTAVDNTDHGHCRFLRPRHPRPRRHAAETRDECAPSHPSLPNRDRLPPLRADGEAVQLRC